MIINTSRMLVGDNGADDNGDDDDDDVMDNGKDDSDVHINPVINKDGKKLTITFSLDGGY